MKKVALVTGTSSGLGLELSLMLAAEGYTTYATMRNLDKQSALQAAAAERNVELRVRQLDVQSADSVTQCVETILAEAGQIDLLVNNAGAGYVRTTEQACEADIQWVLDVNLMGVIRCTKAVLPGMRERRSGHVINISSVGGLVGQPFNEIYCAAKFAVEGYTESLACYVQPSFNINFTSVQPGGIMSEFASSALGQFQSSGGMIDDEYKPLLEKYIGGAQARAATGIYQTSAEVAQVVLDAIKTEQPPIRLRTSAWAEDFCQLKTGADPDGKLQQAAVVNTFLS